MILLVTHDLGVIAEMCDRVAVMYAGRIVETGTTEAIFDHPSHPYTAKLLEASPRGRPVPRGELSVIPGIVPSDPDSLSGCKFAPRCDRVQEACRGTWNPNSNGSEKGQPESTLTLLVVSSHLKKPRELNMTSNESPLLEVNNLSMHFTSRPSWF